MKSWSDAKRKLEQDFLAPSLRGRVQYFMTRYTHAHDEAGRVAIRVDGREAAEIPAFGNGIHSVEVLMGR